MKKTCDRCGRSFGLYKQYYTTPHACPFCGRNMGIVARVKPKKPCGCDE